MQKKGESQRSWDVIGLGENSVDLVASIGRLPERDGKARLDRLTTLAGGQVATALVGCARLGLRARYVGAWGNDPNGVLVRTALVAAGVDVAMCREAPAATRTAVILVEEETRSRTVLWQRDEALDWPTGEVPVAAVADARVLLVDATDVPASVAMAQAARSAGVTTVADVDANAPGLEALLQLVDVLVVPASFSPDLRRLHRDTGARAVIATLGPDGAVAWDGTTEHYSPGYVVPVADTTGAGDAFRAGLIAAFLAEPWTRALDFANACAALNCQAVGAQAGLPTRGQVDALVTSTAVTRSKGAWGVAHTLRQAQGESLSGERE